MRTSAKLMTALLFLQTACLNDKLSQQEAEKILGTKYPRVIETYIYGGDAKYAQMLQAAGLDTEGYVTVKKTKKLGDNSGWVTYNAKALPYLLETSESDRKALVQKVKAGEEQLSGIINIGQQDENGIADITYTTKVTAITPFGKLIKLKDGEAKQHKARLIKVDDRWQLKQDKK